MCSSTARWSELLGGVAAPPSRLIIDAIEVAIPNRDLYRSQSCIRLSSRGLPACVVLLTCHSFHFGTRVRSTTPLHGGVSAVFSSTMISIIGVCFAFSSEQKSERGAKHVRGWSRDCIVGWPAYRGF